MLEYKIPAICPYHESHARAWSVLLRDKVVCADDLQRGWKTCGIIVRPDRVLNRKLYHGTAFVDLKHDVRTTFTLL